MVITQCFIELYFNFNFYTGLWAVQSLWPERPKSILVFEKDVSFSLKKSPLQEKELWINGNLSEPRKGWRLDIRVPAVMDGGFNHANLPVNASHVEFVAAYLVTLKRVRVKLFFNYWMMLPAFIKCLYASIVNRGKQDQDWHLNIYHLTTEQWYQHLWWHPSTPTEAKPSVRTFVCLRDFFYKLHFFFQDIKMLVCSGQKRKYIAI